MAGKRRSLNVELPFGSKNIKVASEYEEQSTFIEWSKFDPITKDYLFSIPNEGKRNIAHLMKLKRNGLRNGVSDLFLAYPAHNKHGLWIEMKRRKGGVISEDQRAWINRMNRIGYVAIIAYGWEQAVKYVETYLNGTIIYTHEI